MDISQKQNFLWAMLTYQYSVLAFVFNLITMIRFILSSTLKNENKLKKILHSLLTAIKTREQVKF